ncbi:MAG: tetratricopeptide repeat protein, partial [bacterium]|nr:tetratricopeptide repeat protein [bacterium]
IMFCLIFLLSFVIHPVGNTRASEASSEDPSKEIENQISNDDVPYGVASSWLYGRHMLEEGNIEEALRNLHFAYRAHPDVPDVAWDFQAALFAGNYFKDALEVLNTLVTEFPEKTAYRLQRSQVYMQLGDNKKALADLRELRNQGYVDLDVIVGEATILANMGKIHSALDVCRGALASLPDQGPRLYLTMSVILDENGRQDEIPDLLREGLITYPDSPQLHDILIRSLVSVGLTDDALKAAQEADLHFRALLGEASPVEEEGPIHPSPPSFVVELADIYTQKGVPQMAIDLLQPLWDEGTLAVEPSLWLARLYLGTGQTIEGINLVDDILDRYPESGEAWFIRGRGLESQGEMNQALEHFAQGAQFAPNDPQVRLGYLRGMLVAWESDFQAKMKSQEQQDKVEILKEQVLQTKSLVSAADTEGQLVLGYAFRSCDQLTEAVDAFSKAAYGPGLEVPATLQLSVCYDELDKPDQALQVLEQLQNKYPDDAEVANSLGYYLAEKGLELDKAFKLISQALEAGPGTGAYLDSMGWVLYQQGKTDKAFDYMIQAVNVLPDDPIILEHLGVVLLKMGQGSEAEEMFKRALLLGGDKERLEDLLDDAIGSGGGH